ncbi:MAG: alpha-glucosidase C-terminal domain-containing protein, partial [Acidimicrobiia bacterium]
IYLGDRKGVRTPMQWTSDRNAGFSSCDPERLYAPVIANPVYSYQAVNVERQIRDSHSMLNWMRNLVRLRKRHPVFGRGSLDILQAENSHVLVLVRQLDAERVLCVFNLSRFPQPVELDLSRFQGLVPTEMFGDVRFPPIGALPYFLTLGPHNFLWLKLVRPAG